MTSGRTVGIIGAGQLARMMAEAASPLSIPLVVLAASADDGAAQVIRDVIIGSPDDEAVVRELAEACDVLTFDHELVDPDMLARLVADGHRVWPSPATMALAQNKRRQRAELRDAGMPVPEFANVESAADVVAFGDEYGWPVMVKASRGGYDGRGVWKVDHPDDVEPVIRQAHAAGLVLLVEECLPLDFELAVLTARRPGGDIAIWEPIETVQRDGMCNELSVPVRADARVLAEAVALARRIVEHIEAVGVLAIEFFVSDGRVLVNELAPRPHNSGHWTIEGSQTSQFEQHLRAILDWPLGDTGMTAAHVATHNVLGPADGSDPETRLPAAMAIRGAHVHLYGKAPKPGRKLGHVTVTGDDPRETAQRAAHTVRQLTGRKDDQA